ncbi:MAG: alginate export family protein [Woeseiaceae bacterium]|nr:alginate export family protein [Woeseiaceae bacterium]
MSASSVIIAVAGLAQMPAGSATAASIDAAAWEFSGDIRERATYASAIDFDENTPDTGSFWAQRLRLTADYEDSEFLAGRVTFLSALQTGLETNPVEQNLLDLQEAWLQLRFDDVALRVGRQEIVLGSQRLVGSRDGTNVRRNWDGVRATLEAGGWHIDTFGLQLVDVEPNGVFNDSSDDDRVLAGVYATGDAGWTGLDLYYLYARFDERLTIEGLANEDRHSVGARGFGERGRAFWNWEAVYQFGRHGANDIGAWTLATNTGLQLDGAWSPRLLLSVNVASGDSAQDDGKLETFDALYPRGNYFSELAQLGPANFFNVNPYLTVTPTESVTMQLDLNLYWRLETSDGIYGPAGNLIRLPGDSDERFVNTALSASIEWELDRQFLLGLSLTHSRPEAFIEDTGPADISNFAQFTLEARF